MSSIAKARELIILIRRLAPIMTEKEVSDVARILIKVTERLGEGQKNAPRRVKPLPELTSHYNNFTYKK